MTLLENHIFRGAFLWSPWPMWLRWSPLNISQPFLKQENSWTILNHFETWQNWAYPWTHLPTMAGSCLSWLPCRCLGDIRNPWCCRVTLRVLASNNESPHLRKTCVGCTWFEDIRSSNSEAIGVQIISQSSPLLTVQSDWIPFDIIESHWNPTTFHEIPVKVKLNLTYSHEIPWKSDKIRIKSIEMPLTSQ